MARWLLIVSAVVSSSISCVTFTEDQPKGLQCKDEKGVDVEWFVVLKFPVGHKSPHEADNGQKYMYITSKTFTQGWIVANDSMGTETNLIARTIQRMYLPNEQELWLIYNDQPPKTNNLTRNLQYDNKYGHTKGVLGGNSNGGFWLIHSIPHFPALQTYEYPKTATRYGQSALCVSLPPNELDKIGGGLKFNYPDFIRADISQNVAANYPTLKSAVDGKRIKTAPWFFSFNLSAVQQQEFLAFAKDSHLGKDLYGWVASVLNTDLYTETWQNEKGPLPPSCTLPRKVMNVREIFYKPLDVMYSSHKDHSKWAISAEPSSPFVCIGDINRAIPQETRGGGTVCIANKDLWKAFNDIIKAKDSCS